MKRTFLTKTRIDAERAAMRRLPLTAVHLEQAKAILRDPELLGIDEERVQKMEEFLGPHYGRYLSAASRPNATPLLTRCKPSVDGRRPLRCATSQH
jgi:hypothetical protein